MRIHSELDDIAKIQPEERDHYLGLAANGWGQDLDPARWQESNRGPRHFKRVFHVHDERDGGISRKSQVEELILPFPSVPIYGINRKTEYGKTIEGRTNMHSIRLLRRPRSTPVHRLFVLHNGLNEADSMKFYYQLADWIMRQQEGIRRDQGVACLVMPFPGHLTDASFHGPFAETPLSRYLSDAGELYRQFLRYMAGFRWLLGMVADSDAESWMVGGSLLDADTAVDKIDEEAIRLHRTSEERLTNNQRFVGRKASAVKDEAEQSGDAIDAGAPASLQQVKKAQQLLRAALRRDAAATPEALRVHVVGYSLGGFVAQSVFFAWPQVVSSCTTVCSGGAISALAPTAFAQPEEWQSVLHALRPEITNSMLQGRLGDDERRGWPPTTPVTGVAGMALEQYGYYQRIFEQVFLQEDRDSYKERLSEYSLRMLFVSGGEDPIAPPANILDASPRDGTTMLSVAGMTHFLNQDPKDYGDRREAEQRDFWLPEAGGLIARAAIHAEQVHMHERDEAAKLKRTRTRPGGAREEIGRGGSKRLSNGYMFEEALDWVLDAVDENSGCLFLCRNALPAAFIPPDYFTRWGTALQHHDMRIQRYALGLRHRARMLRRIKGRTTLIVPEQLHHWFVDLSAHFDPQSDAPMGRETTTADRRKIWRGFERKWWPCIRHFQSGNIAESDPSQDAEFSEALAEWLDVKPAYLEATQLPDVWVGIEADSQAFATGSRKLTHDGLFEGVVEILKDSVKVRQAEREKRKKKPLTKALNGLELDLAKARIRIVQIAGTEFNPRYRGRIEKSPSAATRILTRIAAGLATSSQIPDPHGAETGKESGRDG